jgi:hypothetical protein
LGIPHIDAVKKDDLDLDAGRHLDDGLVLFSALDEVLADRVSRFARTLAETSGNDVGRRQGGALLASAQLSGENAIGVGRKAAPEPADDAGKQGLADEIAFAADDTPDFPAKLMKPLTSLTATRPPG